MSHKKDARLIWVNWSTIHSHIHLHLHVTFQKVDWINYKTHNTNKHNTASVFQGNTSKHRKHYQAFFLCLIVDKYLPWRETCFAGEILSILINFGITEKDSSRILVLALKKI